tara:strand:+ start:768 stop:1442 length:675 start_codon:yes stop_codon:yes gene_type:complete
MAYPEKDPVYSVGDVQDQKKRKWTLFINGKEVDDSVGSVYLVSPFGTLQYGWREGYDGWAFREVGGGGAITVPYFITPEGELYVGLVKENRPNMGSDPVWCAIGGFVDPGESHEQAQARETVEEVGIDSRQASELPGYPLNANRAFFIADPRKGEGVRVYGLHLPFSDLERVDNKYKIIAGRQLNHKSAANLGFFPWQEAVNHADALACSGIARVVAKMHKDIL